MEDRRMLFENILKHQLLTLYQTIYSHFAHRSFWPPSQATVRSSRHRPEGAVRKAERVSARWCAARFLCRDSLSSQQSAGKPELPELGTRNPQPHPISLPVHKGKPPGEKRRDPTDVWQGALRQPLHQPLQATRHGTGRVWHGTDRAVPRFSDRDSSTTPARL